MAEDGVKSKFSIIAWLPEIGVVFAIGLIVWLLYPLRAKLFGSKAAQEDAVKLGESDALSDNTINALNKVDNKFRVAIKDAVIKKYGAKATAADVADFTTNVLLPNKNKFASMIMQIMSSYSHVGSNDAGKITNVFKTLKSQFEINAFATDYAVVTMSPSFKPFIPAGKSVLAGDLYKALDDLLHDTDESALLKLIDAKPLI